MDEFSWRDGLERYGRYRLTQLLAAGDVVRLQHNTYVHCAIDRRSGLDAALRAAGPGFVAMFEAAAEVHGFNVLVLPTIDLTGGPGATARAQVGRRIHAVALSPPEIDTVSGVAVTTPARTVVDLTRLRSRIDGLAVADAALRLGACTPADLAEQLTRQHRARGVRRAREIVALADRRAESPMESRLRLRLRIADAGLPTPQVQYWVSDGAGRPLYRLDLAWPRCRLGLEYDGIDHLDRRRQRADLERRLAARSRMAVDVGHRSGRLPPSRSPGPPDRASAGARNRGLADRRVNSRPNGRWLSHCCRRTAVDHDESADWIGVSHACLDTLIMINNSCGRPGGCIRSESASAPKGVDAGPTDRVGAGRTEP